MERREKTINEKKYQILLPSVLKAMPLCTRVATLLGPMVGTLGKDAKNGGFEVFSTALQHVDPDKVNKILMDAVEAAHLCYEGKPISAEIEFEKHFSQYRADLFLVAGWALWECVRDFFPQLAIFTQVAKKAMTEAVESASPKDGLQTGGPGVPFGRDTVPGQS